MAEHSAIGFFTARIARRNHLGLFLWLCALLLPAGLQLLAGAQEDVRSYLNEYYGIITLYLFFIMTISFGTVFATYYLLGGLRKAGSLDSLRLSGIEPAELLRAVVLGMLRMVSLPLLAFFAGALIYSLAVDESSFMPRLGWLQLAAFALIQLLNLTAVIVFLSVFVYRGSEYFSGLMALAAGILGVLLNILPITAIVFLNMPAWLYLLLLLALIAGLYRLADWNLARLWRAQKGAV